MPRLALIANPRASGFSAGLHRDIVEILSGAHEVTTVWPDHAEGARRAAGQAAAEGAAIVVAMGGDGVAHRVANGLAGTSAALGIVPAGTTNVLSRILGLPVKPRDSAEAIASARGQRTLPLLEILAGEHTRTLATFAAGVGFDAEAVAESDLQPLRKVGLGLGPIHYARSTLKVAARYRDRHPTMRVDIDGREIDAVAVMVQVHDKHTFLGSRPLRLGPGAGPIAAVVSRVTPLRLLRLTLRAALDRPLSRVSGVSVFPRFGSLAVTADPEADYQADGELLGSGPTFHMAPTDQTLLVVD